MLIILFIITPYQCGQIARESSCELATEWYICSAVFTIIAGYTGYRVYRSWNIMVDKLARIIGLKTSRME